MKKKLAEFLLPFVSEAYAALHVIQRRLFRIVFPELWDKSPSKPIARNEKLN